MPLTPDEIRALTPSETPLVASEIMGDNRQATLDNAAAIPSTITDVPGFPALGAPGTVLTVDGPGTGLEFAAASGGGFINNPMDWPAVPNVQGAGCAVALDAATYPDLADADGGQACASGPIALAASGLRFTVGSDDAFQGIDLGNIAANAGGAAAVRVAVRQLGVDYGLSVNWRVGIFATAGTNTATDNMVGMGVGRFGTVHSGNSRFFLNFPRAGRPGLDAATPVTQTYTAPGPMYVIDLGVTVDAATGDTVAYWGRTGGFSQFNTFSAFAADGAGGTVASKIALMGTTDNGTLIVDVWNVAPPADFAALPLPS